MGSVWVIEQGCYSDYHMIGVFSSKEKAELVMGKLKKDAYDAPSISEWPLDPGYEELSQGYTNWLVTMLRDGSVERCDPWAISGYGLNTSLILWKRSRAGTYKGKGIPDCLHGIVLAKDATHAIKIANEKRAQMIALGKWDA